MAKYDKETKFYWLQLKEDFFEEDSIEWLEEQENGHKYSLFYLKLCLKSLKSNGVLIRKVGNMLVPYDNKKLAEMTKTPVDTVIVAMELLKGIGLIKVLENGELYVTQLENLIGSTSKGALKKQQQRALKNQELLESGQKEDNCPPKIKIELKDKDIIKDKEIVKEKTFKRPTIEEVQQYCNERNNNIDAEHFVDYYNANGWKVGKNSMKDWKACIRTWEKRETTTTKPNASNQYKREEIVPKWFNTQTYTTETQEFETIDLLAEIEEEEKQEKDFEARKQALQEKLRSKYGRTK